MTRKPKRRQMAGDAAPEALSRLQARFAGHIRDPRAVPAPEGIEDRRMAVYRELFFNNIRDFLSGNFPVLRSLYTDSDWTTLCRDFYASHRCHTPLFPELPREFLQYLQDQRQQREDDPPFLPELAHYEWVELALALDETETGDIGADRDGDLLHGIPVMSPLVWPLSYRFPVHRICADYRPQSPPEDATHLLVWRRADYEVKFMQLNETTMLLARALKENTTMTGLQILEKIAATIRHPRPGVVLDAGTILMEELREKQIILGTR